MSPQPIKGRELQIPFCFVWPCFSRLFLVRLKNPFIICDKVKTEVSKKLKKVSKKGLTNGLNGCKMNSSQADNTAGLHRKGIEGTMKTFPEPLILPAVQTEGKGGAHS